METSNWLFLASNLNSTQKAELTKQALYALKATGIHVVSLTFDRCSTNVTMARLFGFNVEESTMQTAFTVEYSDGEKDDISIFIDPAHMIKLVRNAFDEKKIFKQKNDYLYQI